MENYPKMYSIPHFDCYFTTKSGEIYSNIRQKVGSFRKLKQRLDKDGYPRVALYQNKKRFDLTTHIIQAMTFICNDFIPKGSEVNHLDGDKLNTHYGNFEVTTRLGNIIHSMYELGNSKLRYDDAQEIRKLRSLKINGKYKHTLKDLALMYSVSQKNIEQIIYNVSWQKDKYESEELKG